MVIEIVENNQFFFALENVLRRCPPDFGRTLGFGIILERRAESLNTCMQCVCYCNDLLNGLNLLPEIQQVLELSKHKAFARMKKTLENEDYKKIQEKIEEVLEATPTNDQNQRTSRREIIVAAIKAGKSDAIDLNRKIRENLLKEFDDEVNACSDRYRMSLTKKYTVGKGYHMFTSRKNEERFERDASLSDLMIVDRSKTQLSLTSDKISKLNARIHEAEDDIANEAYSICK